MHWFVDGLKNYTGFDGRAHRTEFWMYMLFWFIIYVGLMIVESLLGLPGIISGIYWLGTLLPNIAVAMRRLHDTDRTGWWLLIGFVPVIGFIVLIIFYCIEGTSGNNQYGPDPKGALA